MTTWHEATWAALQRQAHTSAVITRPALITHELPTIIADVGSTGATPHQTLSRVLQELRDEGVVIFDGNGHYRLAAEVAAQPLEQAIVTEAWALQKARIGQGRFRSVLMERWSGRCPLTGIDEPALLRASHIVPWNRCHSDAERLDPDNGLLLSAHWDAAFDRRLVSFDEDGRPVRQPAMAARTFELLCAVGPVRLERLTEGNRARLQRHRAGDWD